MDRFVADFHIHSRYSHDSFMRPEKILAVAREVGLDVVAITDHNSIQGGLEGRKYQERSGIQVIVGSEVKSDAGDIIGLSIEEEIRSRAWKDVIDEIKGQGGIVVLPHPYRSHHSIQDLAEAVDLVEVWNARSTPEQNAQALELASRLGKKGLMGSDAHLYREIGSVKVAYEDDSWVLNETLCARYASTRDICSSQVIGHMRKGEFLSLILEGGKWVARKVL
ncbi:PHP domain-containing protein [Methanofollis aquaemaris]|uniref:PHP domain-containing protein n=1 Tax=Methanofollis aquaemaris TaxID=126734 RepID=A0A8A3S8N5_9EURY|nr:PHP domain-containing protein [Methanofollis aquaemaris]QSZ67926.1 PHP domain-containing protein [Methanofollis aquaemaris]